MMPERLCTALRARVGDLELQKLELQKQRFQVQRERAIDLPLPALAVFLTENPAKAYGRLCDGGEKEWQRDLLKVKEKVQAKSAADVAFKASMEKEMQGQKFGEVEYWDRRYGGSAEDGAAFDWYFGYEELQSIMLQFVPKDAHLLVTGCGDSPFSADAYQDGYTTQLNVDNSQPVITAMARRHAGLEGLRWRCLDLCAMDDIPTGTFGAAVDKAVLDCILCDDLAPARAMLSEVHRVLAIGGILVLLSVHSPGQLERLVDETGSWVSTCVQIQREGGKHSILVAQKAAADADEDDPEIVARADALEEKLLECFGQ
jgi:SAM-dependent methyltransferase